MDLRGGTPENEPAIPADGRTPPRRRILVLGASGTIGRATVRALVDAGHDVVCFVRPRVGANSGDGAAFPAAAEVRCGAVTDARALARDGFRGERFDTLVSCLASRTGAPDDAWRIDHAANVAAFEAARDAGVSHIVLLSAICIQKPRLAFQQAKRAAEAALIESGIVYTIVRPTAFFKSLSGQVARVAAGKPYLMFGDGRSTACKPISNDDLARYLARCVIDPACRNRILPIGGPGAALTPRDQADLLFALTGRPARFRRIPVALIDTIVAALAVAGRFVPGLTERAELARIGRYYATESMLVLDPATGRYDADATPSTGSETLATHYARLLRDGSDAGLGDHAVFDRRRARWS